MVRERMDIMFKMYKNTVPSKLLALNMLPYDDKDFHE